MLQLLARDLPVALVSDAGALLCSTLPVRCSDTTSCVPAAGVPGVSDPGAQLVAAAVAAGHAVIPIPGPSACLAALVASGLRISSFTFVGFLPVKAGLRQARLAALAGQSPQLCWCWRLYAALTGLRARQSCTDSPAALADRPEALILFAPARSVALWLNEAAQALGPGRPAVVAREMTKVCCSGRTCFSSFAG